MRCKSLSLLALICVVLCTSSRARAQAPPALRILVPAYFYPVPSSPWQRLDAAAQAHPGRIYAIGNPSNGPGAGVDPTYTATFQSFRASGGKLLGYVHSSYGQRPLTAVRADIEQWFALYPIDGIFVDEMDNTPGAHERYYAKIYKMVQHLLPETLVIGNPGTSTVPSYLQMGTKPVASAVCIQESSASFLQWTADPWVATFPRDRFYTLPYAVGASNWQACVDHAFAQNSGWFYTTDDVLPNPWDTLPAYFESMVGYVAATY